MGGWVGWSSGSSRFSPKVGENGWNPILESPEGSISRMMRGDALKKDAETGSNKMQSPPRNISHTIFIGFLNIKMIFRKSNRPLQK